MSDPISGVLPSLLTPFDEESKVDFAAFERHVRLMLASGVHGLIVASTLGEAGSLSEGEKLELVRCARAAVGERPVPVVAASVGAGLSQDRARLRAMRDCGATTLLLFPPVTYRPTGAELVEHVVAAMAESGLPTLVFNKPATFGCDFTPQLAERVARDPCWVGVKEAAELTARIPQWKRAFGSRCSVLSGDEYVLEALALGADGFVAGLGNAVPAECVAFFRACIDQRLVEAVHWYRWLLPLFQLDVSPFLVQNIKLASSLLTGFPEALRPPRCALAGEERERVAAVVAQAVVGRRRFP
jgi:1-pyrroline-4-hydroxy-2-carboxylate deaminase